MDRDEKDQVTAAASGDAEAFGRLVEGHAGWLLARITSRLGSRDTAEDLLQEVFLAAWEGLATLRTPGRFPAWLRSIADNHVRMWQRRRLTQLDLLERFEVESAAAPVHGREEKRIRSLLREALGRLGDAHRDVIVHHYLKGYSYRQTALLLDLKTETVRSRLQKARSRLHKEIIAMPESSFSQSYDLTAADLTGLRHLARFQGRDHRRILRCVCLDAGGRMVACDGSRLLSWSSRGLASLAAPVVLESVASEAVPAAEGATLVIDEEEATLKTRDGVSATFPIHPGPYVRYEEVLGLHPPGSVSVVAEAAELMACVEGIEPYLSPRHRVESPGWIYNPLVEIRLSGTESRLTLRTSRDLGFSRVEEDAPNLDAEEPEWTHAVACPVRVAPAAADRFRVGVNHDLLKTVVAALAEAGKEIRIRPGAGALPALHFDVRDDGHSALLMPMRMEPREQPGGAAGEPTPRVSRP